MSVMNRQMFQRTMPVRRQTGSPVSGETTVEDYIAKGFDPYEFTADQAMNQQAQQPQQQGFLSKIFDSISDYFTFGRSDPESRLIIGGDYYDPDDPSFKSFIERNYQNEGESYIDGIENFKNEVEGIRNRQEGSPVSGEKSDRFGEKRINRLMEFASGAGDLSKQFDRDEGVAQFTMEDYVKLEGPNYVPEAELKLIQAFGTQDEIETMIAIVERMQSPAERDEEQYKKDRKIRDKLVNKYFDRIGGMEEYFKTHDRLEREFEMDEVYGTKFMPEMRNQGSPMQGETVDPENVGIMSGFKDDEGMASEILKEGENQQKAVDESADYVELMDAIRGNEQTEEQRRDELADVVGETDADKTPESVLVLVQPVMQMLDATSSNEGIAQMDQGQMMMPSQPAGIGATDVVMRNTGSPITGEMSPLQQNFEDNYATYMSLMNRLSDPSQSKAALNFAAANRLLEFGSGQTADDSLKGFIGDINKIGVQEGAKQSQLKTQLAMAALTQAQKQQLQSLKNQAAKTKDKKTFVTGLNKDRDRFIAALLGLYKDAPTGPRGNPMGEGGLETTRVIDFNKLYELYPPGSELQFNYNLTEFLGKKGSTVTYAGKENKAEGGIVERSEGTPPSGENSSNIDIGISQEGVKSTTEIDDINKLIARSNATLNELLRMKQILVDDPGIGGFPGMILENFQGLFTMFNQIDNAYLGNQFIDDQGKISSAFSKEEIQEIQNLKNSIARGIADLASFKGTRQPTTTQEAISLKEIDPTGFFGSEVAIGKVDAVAEKVARLLQEYLKLVTTDDDQNIDLQALSPKIDQLNEMVDQIKNYNAGEGSEGFQNQKTYTLDEIEAIINKQ
tara:strand:+ start:44 stop:2584 length:2541 start_codon:yes stop_codon:yes gene_type:complete